MVSKIIISTPVNDSSSLGSNLIVSKRPASSLIPSHDSEVEQPSKQWKIEGHPMSSMRGDITDTTSGDSSYSSSSSDSSQEGGIEAYITQSSDISCNDNGKRSSVPSNMNHLHPSSTSTYQGISQPIKKRRKISYNDSHAAVQIMMQENSENDSGSQHRIETTSNSDLPSHDAVKTSLPHASGNNMPSINIENSFHPTSAPSYSPRSNLIEGSASFQVYHHEMSRDTSLSSLNNANPHTTDNKNDKQNIPTSPITPAPKKEKQQQTEKVKNISLPHEHDVLCGRGNFVNYHPGNEYYRSLVKKFFMRYVACPKSDKPKFAAMIYSDIRNLSPPGRFLKQDPETHLWSDIGEKKAIDKTRQALREGAPTAASKLSSSMSKKASSESRTSNRLKESSQILDLKQTSNCNKESCVPTKESPTLSDIVQGNYTESQVGGLKRKVSDCEDSISRIKQSIHQQDGSDSNVVCSTVNADVEALLSIRDGGKSYDKNQGSHENDLSLQGNQSPSNYSSTDSEAKVERHQDAVSASGNTCWMTMMEEKVDNMKQTMDGLEKEVKVMKTDIAEILNMLRNK